MWTRSSGVIVVMMMMFIITEFAHPCLRHVYRSLLFVKVIRPCIPSSFYINSVSRCVVLNLKTPRQIVSRGAGVMCNACEWPGDEVDDAVSRRASRGGKDESLLSLHFNLYSVMWSSISHCFSSFLFLIEYPSYTSSIFLFHLLFLCRSSSRGPQEIVRLLFGYRVVTLVAPAE